MQNNKYLTENQRINIGKKERAAIRRVPAIQHQKKKKVVAKYMIINEQELTLLREEK